MREIHINDILKAGHLIFWFHFFAYLNWCNALIWYYLILPILNARIENN
jgi:hypothetical protein